MEELLFNKSLYNTVHKFVLIIIISGILILLYLVINAVAVSFGYDDYEFYALLISIIVLIIAHVFVSRGASHKPTSICERRETIQSIIQTSVHCLESEEIGMVVAKYWWNRWTSMAADSNETAEEMVVFNWDLIKEDLDEEHEVAANVLFIKSPPYLQYILHDNLRRGMDYIVLPLKAYEKMIEYGYKFEPNIWIKRNAGEREFELKRSTLSIYFNNRCVLWVFSSVNITTGKLATEISHHFNID
eukprot:205399_1